MKLTSFIDPMSPSILVLTILVCCCSVLSAQEVCSKAVPPSMNPTITGIGSSNDNGVGILSPLLVSAQRIRESIFNQELPYDVIRKAISEVYNVSALKISPFVTEWVKYSQNALYLSGFVVFVGVMVPLVMVSLWLFWDCCYQPDETDRYESRTSQYVTWSLAVIIFLLLFILVSFLSILLSGNSSISRGVTKGSLAVSLVVEEADKVKNEAVGMTEEVVLGRYEDMLEDIFNKLKTIPGQIQLDVERQLGPSLQALYFNLDGHASQQGENVYNAYEFTTPSRSISSRPLLQFLEALLVSEYLGLHGQLLSLAQQLVDHTHELSAATSSTSAPSLLTSFSTSLRQVNDACSELLLTNQTSAELTNECSKLSGGEMGVFYFPVLADNIGDLGGRFDSLLTNLEQEVVLLKDILFSSQPNEDGVYVDYMKDMSRDLIDKANARSDGYLGKNSSFSHNLTTFVEKIRLLGSSLSLNIPASQDRLMVYLGPHYLENWDEFRSICTIIFALVILFLALCLVCSIFRGLFNAHDLYIRGEDPSNLEGAHQSGTAINKLSFMLTGVCVISALSYGVTLILAGAMGQSCRPNGNLSQVVRLVVDDNRTWGNTYLLGRSVLGDASYPLSFEGVLDRCRHNLSLFQSFHLERLFNLEDYFHIPLTDMRLYARDLQELSQTLQSFSSLGPRTSRQLLLLGQVEALPVHWEDFSSLEISHGLFQDNFVGLVNLAGKISRMQSLAATEQPQLSVNLTSYLASASDLLFNLTDHFNSTFLPILRANADLLRRHLEGNRSSQLIEEGNRLNGAIGLQIIRTASINLTWSATDINRQLSAYLSRTSQSLTCQVGFCHSLSELSDQFSSSVCQDVVPGFDLYWSSLVGVLVFTLCVMILSLFLATQFVDHKRDRSNNKFHVTSAVLRQARAVLWFLLGLLANTWLVAAISRDQYFNDMFCSSGALSGCCPMCVWVLGVVFLLISLLVGSLACLYQCVILHRLSKGIKKVKRFWMEKKKAAQFLGQLMILTIQDIPFLIIAGIYTSAIGILTISSFLSLVISLLGIISYLVYIVRERSNLHIYFLCLRNEFKMTTKFHVHSTGEHGIAGGMGGAHGMNGQALAMNGRALNGRYTVGSESEHSGSDSQGTTQHVDEWMYNPNHHAGGNRGDHRLSVIPEHIEGAEHTGNLRGGRGGLGVGGLRSDSSDVGSASTNGRMVMTIYVHPQDSDAEAPPNTSMRLDRTDSPTESALRHRREEAAHLGGMAGFEVASMRHYDTSSASGFGSKMSMTASGYCSSSQPPDDLYESSDYRDDCDSDYSVHRNRLRLPAVPCEMSVEV